MASTMAVDQPPDRWANHCRQQQCPGKQAKNTLVGKCIALAIGAPRIAGM